MVFHASCRRGAKKWRVEVLYHRPTTVITRVSDSIFDRGRHNAATVRQFIALIGGSGSMCDDYRPHANTCWRGFRQPASHSGIRLWYEITARRAVNHLVSSSCPRLPAEKWPANGMSFGNLRPISHHFRGTSSALHAGEAN